jgi:exonuclease III
LFRFVSKPCIFLTDRPDNVFVNIELKLLSLNVCGIVAKLNCPEFISYVSKFDIIGLQEIKTDDTDHICIPGFIVHLFNRKKITNYRSGGIALLIRENLSPFVTVDTNTDCNLVQFFYNF